MEKKLSVYRGCFLGMAAGDAMGNTVDELSWEDICAEYGPDGLLGYDLRNDSAQVTSYTQIAAFVANGLLLYVTRGRPGTLLPFVTVSLREWLKRQHFPRDPARVCAGWHRCPSCGGSSAGMPGCWSLCALKNWAHRKSRSTVQPRPVLSWPER